jgi:ABC-2 type transport system permease protein
MSGGGLPLFWRTVFARAYPRLIGQQREPAWIFFETFFPLLATAGYVYVYRGIGAPEAFVGFAVMGGVMTAFWVNVMWAMATTLYWDKETGNLPLYIMAPAPLMGILLGMAIGGLLATTLRAAVVLLLGIVLFQVPFAVTQFGLLFAVFVMTMAALYGLGMILASAFLLFGRDAWQIVQVLQEPVYFVSGFYFPVKNLGTIVGLAASLLPLTLGMDAMRQLVFTDGRQLGLLAPEVELLALCVLAVVFVLGARLTLRAVEQRAREQGTLTDRRR